MRHCLGGEEGNQLSWRSVQATQTRAKLAGSRVCVFVWWASSKVREGERDNGFVAAVQYLDTNCTISRMYRHTAAAE